MHYICNIYVYYKVHIYVYINIYVINSNILKQKILFSQYYILSLLFTDASQVPNTMPGHRRHSLYNCCFDCCGFDFILTPYLFRDFKQSPSPPQSLRACVNAQLCLTLCDLKDCSSPGSSVHGIVQVRILEWIVISFSGALPDPGIKSVSPAQTGTFFTTESPEKPSGPAAFLHCYVIPQL